MMRFSRFVTSALAPVLVPVLAPVLVMAPLLGACSVGPNFIAPAPPAPASGYANTGGSRVESGVELGNGPVGRWWEGFGSRDLDALVERALVNNQTLAASDATLEQARQQIAAVAGRRLPQVDANARVEHEEINLSAFGFSPAVLGGGVAISNPTFNLYTVGGGVSYDLDLFHRNARALEQARAEGEAQRQQSAAAHLTIAGRVATQVLMIAVIRDHIAAMHGLVDDSARTVKLTRIRQQLGSGTLVEVLTAPFVFEGRRAVQVLMRDLSERRRSEQALVSVIQEAYVHGVSTRKVEDLVRSMGVASCSKSEVSRMCQTLDAQVAAFRERPLTLRYPYLWLDATFKKVRIDGRVVSNAVVVAYGVTEEGYREVIGVAVGGRECEAFWLEFLRTLVARGLDGVKLVISDAHEGLKSAIAQIFTGAAWQRCWVHFLRNVNGRVSKSQAGMVTEAIKTIFAQPNAAVAHAQLARMAAMLRPKHPEVADMLEESEEDILAYMSFPEDHWRQIRSTQLASTNPLERLNREIGRRCDVVGIFPNQAALLRLVAMVLVEQNDEWQVGRRYMSQESLKALYATKGVTLPSAPAPTRPVAATEKVA